MKTKHIHRDIPLFVSFAGSVIILLLLVAACDNKDYSKASKKYSSAGYCKKTVSRRFFQQVAKEPSWLF